jgi:hypothetical protein
LQQTNAPTIVAAFSYLSGAFAAERQDVRPRRASTAKQMLEDARRERGVADRFDRVSVMREGRVRRSARVAGDEIAIDSSG